MTVTSDIDFTINGVYEGRIAIAAAVDQPAGRYMARTSITEVSHSDEQPTPHPTIDGLFLSGQNYLLTEGSITAEWDLTDDYTAQQRANYEAWFESNDEGARDLIGGAYTYDSVNNKYTVTYTCEFGNTNWRQLPLKWGPKADSGRFILGSGSSIVCFLRIDGEPDAWTVRVKDIPNGTTSTIDKAGATCYVIFSKDVTKDGTTLNAFQAYKISSASFDVSATNDTKVIRLHRD